MKKVILVVVSLLLSVCLFSSCALFDGIGEKIKETVSSALEGEIKELLAAFDEDLDLENFSSEDLRALYEKIFENGDILESVKTIAGLDENGEADGSGDGKQTGEWPANDLTAGVPKPPFKDQTVVFDEDSVTVKSSDTTLDEVKAYAKTLADAGFDVDAVEDEQTVATVTVYSYTAENGGGASVSMTFASGTTTLCVTR